MLILASASPRRHDLLLAAGIAHVVRAAQVCEDALENEAPEDYVRRVAKAKAYAVQADAHDTVLAADTTVALNGRIFGKPVDEEDAARMLARLSGRDHFVFTGICLRRAEREVVDVARTRVTFVEISEAEIREYTRSGEPLDKAGAYGIQGLASKFVAAIEGDYCNVVGLPVSLVYRHLKTVVTG